ncbi:HlyD family type I secretion periplasmic adaptor subunit [Tateyamaria omphalii]|uniref:Membrane fusion protein (MFP) family protein n=1 Tax=Tateyamaria omphalii TaxID=299262 RepID=A0A1P8MTN2_9RHOB|nr:HlyD family type I secretion periplasmic adaptor subunit [Tateyamaria omphalii]APX11353.1 hypothetical protein BWR18_06420 [Tateyamaria omphalii]
MTDLPRPIPDRSPTLQLTVLAMVSLFVACVVGAYVFRVEVVATGEGRIVPATRVQIVQPEFTGIIEALLVRNGQTVAQGDPLVRFDATEAQAQLSGLTARKDQLVVEAVRLNALLALFEMLGTHAQDMTALRDQALATFDGAPDARDNPLAAVERQLLRAELDQLTNAEAEHAARIAAFDADLEVLAAQLEGVRERIDIQEQRMVATQELVDREAASRARLLDTEEDLGSLRNAQVVLQRQRAAAMRNARVAQQSYQSANATRTADIATRLSAIAVETATLDEDLRAARRRVSTTTLTAPTDGIVDRLEVHTIGGVVEGGAPLMRIVPTGSALEIQARFSNRDVGFMAVGQQANIRLHPYPSERFGVLVGTVSDISADSIEFATDEWGYQAIIVPATPDLIHAGRSYALRPGMTASIDVTTNDRRILSYFFAPIIATLQGALRER